MNIWRQIKRALHIAFFTVKTLSYNASRPAHQYLDALFEPVYWFVDNFTAYLGTIFVVAVTLLTSSVVISWYMFLLPVIKTYNTPWMIFHIVCAHYLLVNIIFHYFKAVLTSPGSPPEAKGFEAIPGAVICKKCIQPKPQRSHHCSICNKCYLKMDHHCPWMNNCIGFYNHRYFVSFCIFMCLGTIYVSLSTFDLFTYHFFHPGTLLSGPKRAWSMTFLFGLGPVVENMLNRLNINGTNFFDVIEQQAKDYRPHPSGSMDIYGYEHIGVIYLFLLCSAVTVALSLLNIWHIILITRGETSIEVHVNSSARKKAAMSGMGYNNPYHYGWRQNLEMVFGLNRHRTILSILFPSSHLPDGDGLTWPDNKKPVHYSDPDAFDRYQRSQNNTWRRKFCPC